MSRTLPPIRPKPLLDGSEAFSTIDFPVHYTPEPVRNPALPVKDKMNPAPQPMDEITSSNNVAEHQPVPLAEAFVFQPRNIRQTRNKNDPGPIPMWPSEIHNMSDTTWLLPACSDQASTLASVLRTEIQSHNITREMLHNTERKRLEGAQRCKQLHADIESWATAHKNLTDTLARCANEFSRLSAENVELKTKLDATSVRHQPPHCMIELTVSLDQRPITQP
jgi:hypothetical protein